MSESAGAGLGGVALRAQLKQLQQELEMHVPDAIGDPAESFEFGRNPAADLEHLRTAPREDLEGAADVYGATAGGTAPNPDGFLTEDDETLRAHVIAAIEKRLQLCVETTIVARSPGPLTTAQDNFLKDVLRAIERRLNARHVSRTHADRLWPQDEGDVHAGRK